MAMPLFTRGLACVALALAVGHASSVWAQKASLVNLSHSFPPGPYSAIAVDPSNTDRIAVATEKGQVAVSVDGGLIAAETQAIIGRRYDSMAIRGGARASLAAATPKGERATRLFLLQLREGLPAARWAFWMAMGQPITQISDIALPVSQGDLFVAGPHGVVLGGDMGASWLRVLGGPGPMQREKDMMGMSVVVNPVNPKFVLAATDQGVFMSRDGGYSFYHHPSRQLVDRYISRWYWDKSNPDLLFAVDTYELLLSDDQGETFESVFAAGGELHDVSMLGDSVFIATAEGAYIIGAEGTRHVLPDENILGVVGRTDGSALAISKDTLYWIGPDDRILRILQTSEDDPYMRLVGGGDKAWLLSRQTVLRLGPPLAHERPSGYEPPKLLVTQSQLERAVLHHTGLGSPQKTRIHERWYAKILPRIHVDVEGRLDGEDRIVFDGTFPVRYRWAEAYLRDETYVSVMAFWDLSRFLPMSNTSNPYNFIESNLRENRKAILEQVRWRYREVASLVQQLRVPPADPMLEMAWRSRLAEYSSYLSFMSGREVVALAPL